MSSKLSFLRRIIRASLVGPARACPYCGETSGLRLIGRKKLLLEVLRCSNCALIFRYPTDSPNDNFNYYQNEYESGPVTNFPSEHELASLIKGDFAGSAHDFTPKLQALKALRSSGRVLDFGCSWGYTVRQLLNHGYSAAGFEISKGREALGRERLGIQIFDSLSDLYALGEHAFDVIFANHVLEHLPAPKEVLRLFVRMLADDGLLFVVGPNFTGAKARTGLFWKWIGEEHPTAPTDEFFRTALRDLGYRRVVCGSGPFDQRLMECLRRREFDSLSMEGEELLVIAWRS